MRKERQPGGSTGRKSFLRPTSDLIRICLSSPFRKCLELKHAPEQGKGRKDRYVMLSPAARNLARLVASGRKWPGGEDNGRRSGIGDTKIPLLQRREQTRSETYS